MCLCMCIRTRPYDPIVAWRSGPMVFCRPFTIRINMWRDQTLLFWQKVAPTYVYKGLETPQIHKVKIEYFLHPYYFCYNFDHNWARMLNFISNCSFWSQDFKSVFGLPLSATVYAWHSNPWEWSDSANSTVARSSRFSGLLSPKHPLHPNRLG